MTNLVKSMSMSEALSWKENVGKTANTLRVLLYQGYQGEVWEPLGFKNWTECIKAIATEFQFSNDYLWKIHSANQIESILLDHGLVEFPVGSIPERQLRTLATLPDSELQQKAYKKGTEKAASLGKPPSTKIMAESVAEVKAELAANNPNWVNIPLDAPIVKGDEVVYYWGTIPDTGLVQGFGHKGLYILDYTYEEEYYCDRAEILKISRNLNYDPENPTRQENWQEIEADFIKKLAQVTPVKTYSDRFDFEEPKTKVTIPSDRPFEEWTDVEIDAHSDQIKILALTDDLSTPDCSNKFKLGDIVEVTSNAIYCPDVSADALIEPWDITVRHAQVTGEMLNMRGEWLPPYLGIEVQEDEIEQAIAPQIEDVSHHVDDTQTVEQAISSQEEIEPKKIFISIEQSVLRFLVCVAVLSNELTHCAAAEILGMRLEDLGNVLRAHSEGN